jgi:hypothetical protein
VSLSASARYPAAGEVWGQMVRERLTGMSHFARHLHDGGHLRAGVSVDEVLTSRGRSSPLSYGTFWSRAAGRPSGSEHGWATCSSPRSFLSSEGPPSLQKAQSPTDPEGRSGPSGLAATGHPPDTIASLTARSHVNEWRGARPTCLSKTGSRQLGTP